jgi:hypothetical protein
VDTANNGLLITQEMLCLSGWYFQPSK